VTAARAAPAASGKLCRAGLIAGGAANTSGACDIFGRQLFVAFTAKF